MLPARDPVALLLLHCLYFYSAFFHFRFSAEHVPGVLNVAANALSRNNLLLFSSSGIPHHSPAGVVRVPDCPAARLGFQSLDRLICQYFGQLLAPSTLALYRTASSRFLLFCQRLFSHHISSMSRHCVACYCLPGLIWPSVFNCSILPQHSAVHPDSIGFSRSQSTLGPKGTLRPSWRPSKPGPDQWLPVTPEVMQLLFNA